MLWHVLISLAEDSHFSCALTMTQIVGFSWLAIGLVIGYVKSKGYKVVPEAFRKSDMV